MYQDVCLSTFDDCFSKKVFERGFFPLYKDIVPRKMIPPKISWKYISVFYLIFTVFFDYLRLG